MDQAGHLAWTDLSGASLQMATFTASVGLTQIDARGADFLAAVSEATLGEVSSKSLPTAFL